MLRCRILTSYALLRATGSESVPCGDYLFCTAEAIESIVSQLPKKPLWYSLHFPAHFHIIENIDHDSKYRCAGRRQTDHREARIRLDTHEPGHGQTHDKGLGNSLQHDE